MDYKLTYSTMFNPPAALHERFEAALSRARSELGQVHATFIDGADRAAKVTRELRSPINQDNGLLLLECGASGIRLIPPLMIDAALVDEGIDRLERAMQEAQAEAR